MIPEFLRIPQDVRRAAWDRQPPRPMPLFANVTSWAVDQSVEDFKRQAEEERRIASLNRIAKMKAKMSTGKVDPKTHRWNAKRNRWEPVIKLTPAPVAQRSELPAHNRSVVGSSPAGGTTIDAVTKDNAERIAKLNGVWKDSYGSLQAGLMTMSIKNRLKRLVKGGRAIIFE